MSEGLEFVVRAVLIGVGASLVLDLWTAFLNRYFGIQGLSYRMVGRWLCHMLRGRFRHNNIGDAQGLSGEAIIGWVAHFVTGIIFAAVLLGLMSPDWVRRPTLTPALIFGLATVFFPFFIMQPGLGAGIAASKTPQPNVARLRSLMAHAIFGFGLYLSALLSALLIRP